MIRIALHNLFESTERVFVILDEDVIEQFFLALDMVEEIRLAELERIGNLLHRRAREPLLLHQPNRLFDDVFAPRFSACRGASAPPAAPVVRVSVGVAS